MTEKIYWDSSWNYVDIYLAMYVKQKCFYIEFQEILIAIYSCKYRDTEIFIILTLLRNGNNYEME